jgi:hypothetical protein
MTTAPFSPVKTTTFDTDETALRRRLATLGDYHTAPPLDHRVASASCDLCREAREIRRKLGEAD